MGLLAAAVAAVRAPMLMVMLADELKLLPSASVYVATSMQPLGSTLS